MHLELTQLRKEWKLYHLESEKLAKRLLCLIELVKLKSDHKKYQDWMYKRVASTQKVGERSLRRWKSVYEKRAVAGLRSRKAPGRKRKPLLGWVAHYIKRMRDDYKWGAEVIQAHLEHDFGIILTKYKIHAYLKLKGYLSTKKKKIIRKKHIKIVQVYQPGIHTQMDVKHLPRLLRNGKKCYVYNFVDHASRWQFKMAFESYGAWETYRFMQALLDAVPFKILSLQTDNGIEFSYRHLHCVKPDDPTEHPLEHICKVYGIKKKLIPVGEKEVNGLVERSHRMDDEELYETIRPRDIRQFNKLLHTHARWLNNERRRKPLGWRTSKEYLQDYKENLNKTEENLEQNDTKKAA